MWGGGVEGWAYMVRCNLYSNVFSHSNATWQSFDFLQADIYYQKNSIIKTRKKTKGKIMQKNFLKRKKSVPQKNQ